MLAFTDIYLKASGLKAQWKAVITCNPVCTGSYGFQKHSEQRYLQTAGLLLLWIRCDAQHKMWIPNLSCSCSQKRYDSFNSFEFQIFLDGCCLPAGELLLICCYSHIILIWCLGLNWGESLILLILIWSCCQAFSSECVYMCCQCKQDLIQIKDTEAGIAAQQPCHHQKRPSVSWWLCESTQLQSKARWTILLSVQKRRN